MASEIQKIMEAVITTGEYTNNNGENKKSYLKIGTLFVYADGGMSLKLDAMPISGGNISFYDRKPRENNGQQQQQQQQQPQQGYSQQQQPQQQQGGYGQQQPQQQYQQKAGQ